MTAHRSDDDRHSGALKVNNMSIVHHVSNVMVSLPYCRPQKALLVEHWMTASTPKWPEQQQQNPSLIMQNQDTRPP